MVNWEKSWFDTWCSALTVYGNLKLNSRELKCLFHLPWDLVLLQWFSSEYRMCVIDKVATFDNYGYEIGRCRIKRDLSWPTMKRRIWRGCRKCSHESGNSSLCRPRRSLASIRNATSSSERSSTARSEPSGTSTDPLYVAAVSTSSFFFSVFISYYVWI